MSPPYLSLSLVTALVLAAGVIVADDDRDPHEGHGLDPGQAPSWADEDHSYDRARRASERGEILPLTAIYERVLKRFPGRVLEAELERERGRWIYELKVLDASGQLFEIYTDASTGEIIKHKADD
jgi:hypothetical protein